LRYKEKIFTSHFNTKRKGKSKLVWFHAASVGELKSILPLMSELNKKKNNLKFLLTTVTLSSGNLAEKELKTFNNVYHRYFPLDVKFLIQKFILSWKPDKIILVDSEIWPNLILIANENNIPMAIINARITHKTYNRWKLIPNTAKKIFGSFSLCLTSNYETKKYLTKFKVRKIIFSGNIKLINKTTQITTIKRNKEVLKNNKVWCATNTHKGEDNFFLHTHIKLKEKLKSLITIIAPRHINRVKEIKNLCENLKLNSQILNKNNKIIKNKEVIIINSYGELSNYYNVAKSVFVGKSTLLKLKNSGGQSPIEAAQLGCKIYHGPYVYNFKEIYNILKQHNISKQIKSPQQLAKNLFTDFKNVNKRSNKCSIIMNNLRNKTLNKTMKNINKFLFDENI
jgi:3-deoxy-D-manno-octulosonic-acid transferase